MNKYRFKLLMLLIICTFAIAGCESLIKEDEKTTDTGSNPGIEDTEKLISESKGSEKEQQNTESINKENNDVPEPTLVPETSAKAENPEKAKETEKAIEEKETQAPKESSSPPESETPQETEKPLETVTPTKTVTESPKPTATTKASAKPVATATNKPATTKPTATATTKPATTKPAVTATPKPATTKPAATSRPSTGSIPEAKTDADVEKYNKQGIRYKVGNTYVTPCTEKKAWAEAGNIRVLPNGNSERLGQWYLSELRVTGICDNGFVQISKDVTVYPTGIKASEYRTDSGGKVHKFVYTHKDFIQYKSPIWTKMKGYDPEEVCKKALKALKAKGHKIFGDNEDWLKSEKEILKELEDALPSDLERYKKQLTEGKINQKEYERKCNAQKKIVQDQRDLVEYIENMDYIAESHEVEFNIRKIGNPHYYNQNLNRIPYTSGFLEEIGISTVNDLVNKIVDVYENSSGISGAYKKGKDYVCINWAVVNEPYGGDVINYEKRYCFDIRWM